MKILLIFPKWLGNSGDYCHLAARSLGWDSTLIWGSYHDTQSIKSFFYGTVRRRALVGQAVKSLETHSINRRLIATADSIRPDIIINNCPNLLPDVIETLRGKTKCFVYWAGDDPVISPPLMKTLNLYHFVFFGSPDWMCGQIAALRRIHNYYLPYGCDATVFHPLAGATEDDNTEIAAAVSFVGARYSDREELLSSLLCFDLGIWGWKRDNLIKKIYRRVRGERHSLFHEKYGTDDDLYLTSLNDKIRRGFVDNSTANKIYNSSSVVLNLQHPQMRSAVNSKTFEIAASGGFQLLQHSGQLLGLYQKEKEVVCFDSREDLIEKIAYYLGHQQERQLIATKARERTLREHTFRHRLERIVDITGR